MSDAFDSWAIIELMGHVRMGGRVTEEERFGSKLGRVDVPLPADPTCIVCQGKGDCLPCDSRFTTVYFGGSSVYRLTPTTEKLARAVAAASQPRPVSLYELPKPTPRTVRATVSDKHVSDNDLDDDKDMPF